MKVRSARTLLSEILIQAGLIDTEGVARALERQRVQPGRFGSQLLTLGLVSEDDLAKALSIQFEVPPFLPSLSEVDPAAIQRLSPATARRCRALPFGWEPDKGTLHVVMVNPRDLKAVDEVRFASGARKVAVQVAPEATLEKLISRHYEGVEVAAPASPEIAVSFNEPVSLKNPDPGMGTKGKVEVVLADPDPKRRRAMAALLEASGFRVTRATTKEEAFELSARRSWAAVWIHEEWNPEGITPEHLHIYGDPIAALREATDLARTLRREASDLADAAIPHLPADQPLAAKKAVSLVRFLAARAGIEGLAADCLALRTCRLALSGWSDQGSPLSVPGSEIVTAVTAYENAIALGSSPAEAAEALRTNPALDPGAVTSVLRWSAGEDILSRFETPPRVLMILPPEATERLSAHLDSSGWQVTRAEATPGATEPSNVPCDAVLADLSSGLSYLEGSAGVAAEHRPPVFLLVSNPNSADTMYALKLGAEDVVSFDTHPEVLETKLRRAAARRSPGKGLVTGNLRDMGLADMLQILSNGLKTAVVRVEGSIGTGEVALESGGIVDARVGELEGEEALYSMIGWSEGSFRIIPGETAHRVTLGGSTEGLLMEGFRRLDEIRRAEALDEIPEF